MIQSPVTSCMGRWERDVEGCAWPEEDPASLEQGTGLATSVFTRPSNAELHLASLQSILFKQTHSIASHYPRPCYRPTIKYRQEEVGGRDISGLF